LRFIGGTICNELKTDGSPALLMTSDYALVDTEKRRLRLIHLAHSARPNFRGDAVMRQSGVG
jgi:hypothetical protein